MPDLTYDPSYIHENQGIIIVSHAILHPFAEVWHCGPGELPFHTRWVRMTDTELDALYYQVHNRIVLDCKDNLTRLILYKSN